MSASAITPAQAELISSLSQDDIPIKLRCAICSRLAVNAFRLPCCDQSICETCQSSLPSTCPVCEHSPVASEDCKPHKSLRTTIKVFLRTEEKKREALRLKEAKDTTPPDTPIEPEPTPTAVPTPLSPAGPVTNKVTQGDIKYEPSPSVDVAEAAPVKPEDVEPLEEAQQDIPQPSIEEIAPGQEPTLDADANIVGEDATGEDEGQRDITERNTSGQPTEVALQTPVFGAPFGLDGGAATGFPGAIGFSGDMSQVHMMMAMQNGMAPSAFGAFPMMGMPGMNMDPMLMQNMFMNGGFGAGMGMNSMNISGMGMGGFDSGVGGGFSNGWNGQQSWNIGPDNFNHPNAAGMGPGDYGANNSGYAPHAAGYNQGNYGHGNQYNDYQNSFGYRGRGRGRGGYGRGGYGYGSHESFSQQYPQQYGNQANGAISETGSIPTGPKADATPAGNVDEFGREIRQISEAKEAKETPTELAVVPKDNATDTPAVNSDGLQISIDQPSADVETEAVDPTIPKPIQTLDEAQALFTHQNGYPNNQYPHRGGYFHGSSGSFGEMQAPSKPVDIPINAPTGPKAMREGLPNTGLSGLRARFPVPSSVGSRTNGSTSVAPEPSEVEDKGKEKEKEKDRSRSQSRDRERSRSRSRDRKRSKSRERHRSRRRRHRSTSLSQDEKETERRRQRRRERRRRREEEGEDRDDTGSGEKADERRGDVDEDRSRSASPSDSKRSSHRSRRDKDKYRERERDSDREHRSSHKHRSSHRSHRDDRSRSRDRDREREHRYRHSRRGSEDVEEKKEKEKVDSSVPPTPVETEGPSRRPSLISDSTNGIEIKGASVRRNNPLEEIVIPTGPRASRDRPAEKEKSSHRHREDEHSSRHRESDKDKERGRTKEKERTKSIPTTPTVKNPHEEEREARNRERLLKEAQRMAGLTGLATTGSRKRSRDEGVEDGRRGKKKGRRGGVEESDEARLARLEAERESARW